MSYNCKNYTEQNGEKTVIGGSLEIKPEATVTGLPQAAAQADSTATTVAGLVADFNSLLAKLRAAGYLATETNED